MYYGSFESAQDVLDQWSGSDLTNAKVIAAVYHQGSYDGDAMVVFRREGKLFEVHCSHCSCNGLDDWSPEETSFEALQDRLTKTRNYDLERYGQAFTDAVRRGLIDEIFEEEVLVK